MKLKKEALKVIPLISSAKEFTVEGFQITDDNGVALRYTAVAPPQPLLK